MYLAAAGCGSCEKGLGTILALAGDSVELWFVGNTPPNRGKNWHKVEQDQKVTETPTTLFVNAKGDVVHTINGYSTDNRWTKNLDQEIGQFLPQGKKIETK